MKSSISPCDALFLLLRCRMSNDSRSTADGLLRALVEGTSGETGLSFCKSLVKGLADALGVHGAWVTEYLPEEQRLRAIAFRLGNDWVSHYEYDIEGTPCGAALRQRQLVVFPNRVIELFPKDPDLAPLGAVSYMGAPLYAESNGELLGHLALLDTKPLIETERYEQVFRIFANRAGAELRRMRLEKQLRATAEELEAVLESAMDAILVLDDERTIVRANPTATRKFGTAEMKGRMLDFFLTGEGAEKVESVLDQVESAALESAPRLWISGDVQAKSVSGQQFMVEGTVSRFELEGRRYFTLILRDIEERLAAEAQLARLTNQNDYLREEIERSFGEIIGQSPVMRRLRREIAEVAPTDATVLITGETGTGKELVARAVHRASRRADAALVKVNCAAIPAQLIESEFFGHEKGAFTGATVRREGRFALADGGTIFLDEVGELPIELQPKLLRVLQEGEFEMVGSARTRRVSVRVIAATNRDLKAEVEAGRFREDLFYRLHVFPIEVPPLRERGHDIDLLAREFVRRFAEQHGCAQPTISASDLERLRSAPWRGNVRELANALERAVITAEGKRLNLDRALPASVPLPNERPAPITDRIYTQRELRELEVANIRRALLAAGGRVSGTDGAAALLHLKPSTLSSRMKALRISSKSDKR